MPSVELNTPIPANKRSQLHALDHAATGIDNLLTYSFHMAMDQHYKTQEIENKLAILIVKLQYLKNSSMFHTLCHLVRNIMCVLSQEYRYDQQSSSTPNLHFYTSTELSIIYIRVFTSLYQIFHRRIYCDSIQIRLIY